MKKFSLTHKLLAVALAFVLVAVSLPDYLSFAQQPAQEQSETDELADGDPSDTGEQEMEQQVVLHLQAPETVPMGTAGSFGLSAQNTAAVAADVSIQLTQEEMAAYQAAEQDSTLALQLAGDSLTFTLQPGEQVEGTLSFLYPNGYSSREVVEIAEEDISIVLQQLPEEETGGAPIETIPPEGEIQPPEQGQTPPADETQQPGGEGPTDPSDEGETTPPESGDGEEETDPSDGEDETLPPESGDGEEATDSSNEEETTPPDDETDPSVGEGEAMPSGGQEQVLQAVEQSTVSLTQDYQTGPDGELSEEPTTDSKPADESGTTENEGSTEPSGSESGNPTDLENTGSTDSDNAGTGDNSLSDTEDGDQQGNDPTGSQGDGQQDGGTTGSQGDGQQGNDLTGSQGDDQQGNDPTGSQGDGQQSDDPTGSQGDGQQDGGPTGSQGDGQQDGDLTGSQDNVQQGNDLTGSQDESGQEQPQVSFDIVGATLTFTASFGWGELTLTAQPLETEQQEAAAQGAVPQPDLSYTIEAASQNRESTGTIYTRSWSLQQVIALPQGASFVEGEAAVDGNQIRIGATPVLSVDDQSGTAGELSAQRDGETLLVTYTKTLSDWQSLEAESISDLGLAMTLHQESIVRDESFTEGQVDVGATFTATPVTAAAEIAPAAVLAVLDTGDEQQDGSQSVTQQGSLSLPLSGEPQAEQPQSGGADIAVTYTGEAVYTEQDALAVRYTIEVTNGNEPQEPSGGDEGEGQPEGSDGAVTVKIVQNLSDECFSNSKPLEQEAGDSDGDWDSEKKALTWDSVEIKAGESWTKTVTVLIDTSNLDSIEKLPTELNSSILVYAEEGEEGEESTEPIAESSIAVDLRTFVNQPGNIVPADFQPSEQTVYWLDNNASGNRPEPEVYAGKVGLQFYIGNQENPDEGEWITLDENNMAQLGLTEMPDILCPEDNTQSQWTLSAKLPTTITYKGTDITQQVKWRMVPPAENADIPAGPEEGGIRPNLSEVYYLDKVEGEGSETWYYLYRDEVSFNIDLRDAVYADDITADELKELLEKNFELSYEAGTEDEKPLSWEDIIVDIKEDGDGQYTLTLVNAVAYSRNGKGVHYYLKPMGSEDQEKKIPLNQNWPGNGEGGDYYDVECDNTGLDNVGNITDKVANGGTLVLTRQGEIAYHATKVWIDPDGNTDGRPEGHFELWRYTYSEDGGSFKEATTVTGVETVSFENDEKQTIVFTNPNPTEGENENFFPKYDKDGNRYVYIMKEVIDSEDDALSYEQVFGKVGEDGNVIKDSDKAPPIGGDRWVRDEQDNFVYNKGTITNRINEKETVSVTKKWDAASFQASMEDVAVEVTLYGRPKNSNDSWAPVKGQDGEDLVYTMDGFSAANDTMSQTVTVNTYNSKGQEMQYRFFETAIVQGDKRTEIKLTDEELKPGANLPDKSFTLELDGNAIEFVSKRASDTSIEEQGQHIIENVIRDEITFTINKTWLEGTTADTVQFAIYQQGPNAENKLVGIVTLDGTKDQENDYGEWESPAGEEAAPTLTVGDKTYNVTYQVTEDEFKQLKIEGLPRYDEHGYTYEYIALEVGGSAEQTTQIDADGNYITDVVNGPGRGYRIMLRKRWIDNSDIEHREPVTLQVYYQVDEISDLENDFLLATVTLGEEGEPWYELVGFSEAQLEEQLGKDFPKGKDFYKHLYIREISIGNSGADDRTTQGGLSTEENGAIKNSFVDQIAATNHTYEATYETQLGGLTVEEGEDTPGISDPLFIVTNRRLGNVDLTVTKEWQDGSQLQELLKGSNVVPVVKLVFDEEKNNAEPPGNVNNPIDYKKDTVQIGNEAVEIKGKEEDSREEAIQPLLENGELIRELYFYNLPKYDNQGRVARYKVVELWTTEDNINANGKVKDVDECYDLEKFSVPEGTSADLESLLNDLSVSYQEDSYEEKDEQKQNDEQKITITNKLTGTKEIKFYKEWNDQYALEHGKRPDLYLTLYRTTKGSGKMQLYADHSWDKQALTISEDGGENAAQAEKETDENYWICTFPDLPKYDENGDEYIYYAVERLTVNDPSDFDYAPAQFKHDSAEANADLTVTYDENGEVEGELPDDKVEDHQILMNIDGDVALLEGGTFVNSLEEAVTITGRKLWNSVPLTADSADLPTVTFEVYQYLESEVPTEDLHENLDPNLKVATREIKSEEWENLKTDDNQYEFKFDGMEGKDGNTVPFPLYNDEGERYVYILHEVTDEVSDTDWNLVYEDPVYNEYQITNTYDPQRGALNVKKLLEIPTVDGKQYYPAVTFELYQALPEENGNYDFEMATKLEDKTQVWTSEDVEEAAKGGTNLSGGGRLVEKVITFEDLPQYAPNGKEYKYFVVELIEGRMYYESAVVMQDVVLPVDGDRGSVEKTFDSIFTKGNISNGKELPTKVISLTPNKKMEDGSSVTADSVEVSATFGDRYITGAEITLQLTKTWEDQNNALGLRPSVDGFKKMLTVSRYAKPQPGQNNGIGTADQPIVLDQDEYNIAIAENGDKYTITIEGTDGNPLEQYAPNGMPWIYVVEEKLTDTAASYLPVGKTSLEESADEAVSSGGETVLDLGELKNTLTTSQSFQKQWKNHDGGSITEDYLGLGDITITGQLWVREKGGIMQPASDYFTGGVWEKWFTGTYWEAGDGQEIKNNDFQIDLTTQLGDNDRTATISNLPRVNQAGAELVYAIVETGIKVTNPDYTQTFTWKWEDGKLTVESKTPDQGLFTPQEITVGGSTTIINNRLQTTNLSVEKLWVGDENEINLRPLSIDVVVQRKVRQEGGNQSEQADELTRATLMAPRTTEDGWEFVPNGDDKYLTETLEEATGWKASIPNLPTYGIQDNGLVTYDYRIHELKPGWKDDGNLSDDEILDADEKYNGHYTVSAYSEDGLTVTNTLTHMDIIAVKAWKPEGLHGDYAEVTFTLQSRVVGSGDDAWKDVADADGKPVSKKLTGEEDPAWTVTWTELPRTENGQTLEYRVVEKLADGLKEEEHVQFSITPETISSESADKTFTFTVTNIPLGQITVTKEGGDGNGLAGVEFTLKSDSSTQMPVVGTTDVNGELTFAKLPLYDEQTGEPITYTLTESATPDGHIRLEQPIEVSFTAQEKPVDGIYWQTTDGFLLHAVEYEVVNGQYFPVVHTGGSGFYWPGVLGAGAAAAGVLYLIRRKTKGHNTER